MGKVLKVKRLKSSDSKKSTAVHKLKTKWEKPKKKYISSQPGIMKIKNVKKRSFDPIKANRGVVLLQNIPHGFYEEEMRKYFGQFGLVTRLRLARSEKTGHSKGYAFIEFKVPEVAQIAADTMNNYIMFKHVLKTVYIPPDKQTHNYFRKDVKFTMDPDGLKSFSSAKTEQIKKEIERINQPRTDEQHAKMLKQIKKSLDKQGKKYGIDLSSVMVSGNNISDQTSSTSEEEQSEEQQVKKKSNKNEENKPEAKKVEKNLLVKKGEKKLLPKKEEKKMVSKKEEKKVLTKKEEKKVLTKKEEKMLGIDNETEFNGKSLLGELLNSTYDTDTSDDDFKIDHSFTASDDDSSNEGNLFDLLAPKLSAAFKQTKSNTSSDVVDDDASESEDESPKMLKIKKFKKAATRNATNGSADNGSVNSKKKLDLKRKNKEPMIKDAVSSQSEPEIQIKKKKQNVGTKVETTSEISTSEPEVSKIMKKNKNQKRLADGKVLNKVNSSSEQESAIQKKKQKHPGNGNINLKSTISSSEPEVSNQKMKKKQGDGKINLNMTTSSSESEAQNKKVKKNKQKQSGNDEKASNVTTSTSEPEETNLKLKKKKKQNQAADGKIANKVVNASEPVTQNIKKKKLKQAQRINVNSSTTSTEPEVQNPKLKKKNNKPVADGENIPITTINISKPEVVNMKKKKQKVVSPSVMPSPTNENVKAKKDLKRKVKSNLNDSGEADTVTGWTDLPEADGDEMAKPKSKGNLKLKTIVRKKNLKKDSKPNEMFTKKVKQTPADLLQLVPSKIIKQTNQLKSKKKSK